MTTPTDPAPTNIGIDTIIVGVDAAPDPANPTSHASMLGLHLGQPVLLLHVLRPE